MSIPIIKCAFRKALTDEDIARNLKKTLEYNIKKGSMTILPCKCNPPCEELTDEEEQKLIDILEGI